MSYYFLIGTGGTYGMLKWIMFQNEGNILYLDQDPFWSADRDQALRMNADQDQDLQSWFWIVTQIRRWGSFLVSQD